MQINKNPIYRKVIIPWYDSETACFTLIILMTFVFSFGCIGISVALNNAGYFKYIFVPSIILALSTYVIISSLTRLILRIFFSDREPTL